MITLRPNQVEPIRKAVEFFREKNPKPSLIVLPTAWGKSILTAFVAKETDDKIIVLQPSKELLEQNYLKYLTLCGDFDCRASIYSASFNSKCIGKVTYATIGSIKNIGATFRKYGFTKMLIDEAHLYPREADSMLGKFLAESGITHVLGITATPVKLQSNTSLDGEHYSKLVMLTSRSKKGNFFKDIIHVAQPSEMVRLGFWSPLKYQVGTFDGSLLVFNSTKSEYTEESVQRAYEANDIVSQIRQAVTYSGRKHILVFLPSVEDAKAFASRYPDSAAVYGDMDKKEREKVISGFKSGRIRIIFNVRVLSTGFDYTGIDCIILGISTASIALYYQIVGRATRIDPGKKDALIIDLGGNFDRFGKVEDIRFEKGSIWRMFGTGDRLLSGMPIHEIGTVYADDVAREEKAAAERAAKRKGDPTMKMPFGKHKGLMVKDVPASYREWMLNNIEWRSTNDLLRKSILVSLGRG
jgi:DNA repair protein RadD